MGLGSWLSRRRQLIGEHLREGHKALLEVGTGSMRLLASGRDADVFDLGDGRVLRRHKDGRPATKQAELLTYAASHGYPVPALHDASGADLVLEKLDGPEMQQM